MQKLGHLLEWVTRYLGQTAAQGNVAVTVFPNVCRPKPTWWRISQSDLKI